MKFFIEIIYHLLHIIILCFCFQPFIQEIPHGFSCYISKDIHGWQFIWFHLLTIFFLHLYYKKYKMVLFWGSIVKLYRRAGFRFAFFVLSLFVFRFLSFAESTLAARRENQIYFYSSFESATHKLAVQYIITFLYIQPCQTWKMVIEDHYKLLISYRTLQIYTKCNNVFTL